MALKLLGDDTTARDQGRALAALRHRHLVTVYAAGEHQGRPYLALELLRGPSLAERLEQDGALSLPEGLRLGSALASALEALHGRGLCHGDLKPANVLFGAEGPKLIDLAGAGRGTPAYLAPERQAGAQASEAADIWALASVLAEALAGRRLQRVAGVPSLADVPVLAELDNVSRALLERALASAPEDRPSAAAFARALEDLERGGGRPYVGLSALERGATFAGREEEVALARARLAESGVLALVGPSGCGKTSFVQAGLLPTADPGAARVLALSPRSPPFEGLAAALLALDPRRPQDPGGLEEARRELSTLLADGPAFVSLLLEQIDGETPRRTVLLVEDLERWPTDAAPFVVSLAAVAAQAPKRLGLIVTARRRPSELMAGLHGALPEPLALSAPDAAELRSALLEPLAGPSEERVERDLVELLVADLEGQRSAFSLLQLVAATLWRGSGQRLAQAAYEARGGVAGILAQYGEERLTLWGEAELHAARELLLGLCDADGALEALGRQELLDAVEPRLDEPRAGLSRHLEALIDARLVCAFADAGGGGEHLALSHPGLLEAWPRLARWHADERERATLRAEVKLAAELWRRRGEDDSELWAGPALAEVTTLLSPLGGEPEVVRAFVDRGLRRRRGRRSWVSAAVVATLLAAVVSGAVAARCSSDAPPAASSATSQQDELRRWRETALAAIEGKGGLEARARLASLVERLGEETPRVRGLWCRLRRRRLQVFPRGERSPPLAPSARRLYARPKERRGLFLRAEVKGQRAEAKGTIVMLDPPRGNTVVGWSAPAEVRDIALRGAGTSVAVASGEGLVTLRSARTGALLDALLAPFVVTALRHEGADVLLGGAAGERALWSPIHPPSPVERGHRGPVVALAARGEELVSVGADGTQRRWSRGGLELGWSSAPAPLSVLVASGGHLWGLSRDGRVLLRWGSGRSSRRLSARWRWVAGPGGLGDERELLAVDARHRLLRIGADGQVLGPVQTPMLLRHVAVGPGARVAVLDLQGRLHLARRGPWRWRRLAITWQGKERRSQRKALLAWASETRLLWARGEQLRLLELPADGGGARIVARRRLESVVGALASFAGGVALGTAAGTVEYVDAHGRWGWPRRASASAPAAASGPLGTGFELRRGALHWRGEDLQASHGVSAAERLGEGSLVGYSDGTLRWFGDANPVELAPGRGSAVTRLLPLPARAFAVGYADGELRLYQLSAARPRALAEPLHRAKLHGAIVSLRRAGPTLRAGTRLGDSLSLDIGPLTMPWSELLAALRAIPLRWSGRIVLRAPKTRAPKREQSRR